MTRMLFVSFVFLFGSWGFAGEPTRILLVGQGPDGHPPQTHEFMAGVHILEHLLQGVPGVVVTTANGDEPWANGPSLLDQADGVVLYLSQGGMWMRQDPERYEALGRLAERGGGIVALHWAIGAKDAEFIEPCLRFLGGCHGGPDRKYVKLETTLTPSEPRHTIASGLSPVRVMEEIYYRLKFTPTSPGVRPVLSAELEGGPTTAAWAWERPDGGRSFGFVGLHYHKNWREEMYRRMVLQGVLWAVKREFPESLRLDCPEELLHGPAS